MKDRITLLIKAKNLTAAQFADEIGVQKSSISHVLSGRNNASLDFIQKILLRYPEVSMEWLMFGKGPIFKSPDVVTITSSNEQLNTVQPAVSTDIDLFSAITSAKGAELSTQNDLTNVESRSEILQTKKKENGTTPLSNNNIEGESVISLPIEGNQIVQTGTKKKSTKSILKIVEFYSDNTFREFYLE